MRTIDLEPGKVVKACCAIHNWIKKTAKSNHGITTDVEDVENGTVYSRSWRDNINIQGFVSIAPTRERNFNLKARDGIVDYFRDEDTADWQLRMVDFQATAMDGLLEEVEEYV